jgi:hypothetical protein
MIRFLRILETLVAIAVVAISFFITYGFFLKHLSYVSELYIVCSAVIIAVATAKFIVKLQPLLFFKNQKIEHYEAINAKGKSRIFLYEALSWLFKLGLLSTIIKFFGMSFHLTWAFLFMIAVDVAFWALLHKKFSAQWINNTLVVFTARPQIVSFSNVKKIESRYGDFYITYKNGKVTLLKTDLISEALKEKISSVEIASSDKSESQ